jgi:16S rRNA (guanine1207-N2)-methyltransferase
MNQYFNNNNSLDKSLKYINYEFKGEKFRFATHDGVFSKDHVDHATDILLSTIPMRTGTLLDLGCGYGVIGIVLSKIYELELTSADVNPAAVELTRLNGAVNVIESDCFENITGKFDTIVINPPIHAGKSVTYKMYEESLLHLNKDGKLYIVTFKKHGAESTISKIKEVFGNCDVIYKKKGIYVIETKNSSIF